MSKVVMITSIQPYTNYSSWLLKEYDKINGPELLVYAESSAPYPTKNIKIKPIWQKGLKFFYPVLREIFKDKPEIIHLQYELNMYGDVVTNLLFPLFLLILKSTGAKIIVTQHAVVPKHLINRDFVKLFRGDDSFIPPIFLSIYFNIFNRMTHALSDHVIVHTKLLKKWLVEDYGYSKNKIQVIEMGVPLLYKPRKKLPTEKYFLHFGYLARRKGLDKVIKGFAKFIDSPKYKDFKLYFSGGVIKGQEFAVRELKDLISALGISDNVKFLKYFEGARDFNKYLGGAYSLVSPAEITISASGPLSKVFGYHKCTIASKVGNFKSEIKHKVDGYLVSNNGWTKAFKELADNPKLVQTIENGAAKKAEQRSWKSRAKIHKELYAEFLLK